MTTDFFDRYEKKNFLAVTPSGNAFLAEDKHFQRKVILKEIPKTDANIKKRFENIIKTAGQIIHPSVLTIMDFAEDENNYYLIQEFIDLEYDSFSLNKIASLDINQKIEIILDIIDALQFAYESNIIHKNLYLDSIYLTKNLKVKIDNFGIDRVVTKNNLISELGLSTSPPPFIPPEKIAGKHSTYKSDIFQLGCIIFTLFTTIYPFGEKISENTLLNIKKLNYPHLSLFSNVPDNIKEAIKQCLKLDPNQRINNYQQLIEIIKDFDKKQITVSEEPFNIIELDKKLYLVVNDPKISKEKILEVLIDEGYLVDENKVDEAIKFSKGNAYLISERVEKFDLSRFKDITLTVSQDRLEAYLSLPKYHNLTKNDIIYFLKKNHINYGINEENIEKILKNPSLNIPVSVGKKPINGTDAYLIYFFEKDNIYKPKILDNDNVDFKEINFIQPVKKNDVLCVKIPYTEGIDGIDVYGRPIKAKPGKDVKLPVGKNTYVSSDGLKLISTVDGQITYNGNQVNVIEVIIINSNVDYSVGNINYHGDVIINGDVLSGFDINAGGDIKIRGIVEGCKIISENGSIVIIGGVFGKNKAVIKALKKIITEFIQDAEVFCEQDIEVLDYVRNSKIVCNGYFKCIRKTGTVHTCSITASDFIEVNIAGTIPYTKTQLKIIPLNKTLIKQKLNSNKEAQNKINNSLSYVKEIIKKIILKYGNIEDAVMDKEYQLNIERLKQLEQKLKHILVKEEILNNLYERSVNHSPFIKINKTLYSDVILKIGNYSYTSHKDYFNQILVKIEEGDIQIIGGDL